MLLENMMSFKPQFKLQEAVLTYMASQLATNKEKEMLQNTFLFLDSDGDGKLSTSELCDGFEQIFGNEFPVEEEVASLMEHLDIDKSGYIDYTEFVLATINKKTLLTPERLKIAFNLFDTVRTL